MKGFVVQNRSRVTTAVDTRLSNYQVEPNKAKQVPSGKRTIEKGKLYLILT